MEITYKISEKEFSEAWALQNAADARSSSLKTVLFWIFILICLMLLWSAVEHNAPVQSPAHSAPATHAIQGARSWTGLLPFIGLAAVWFVLIRQARVTVSRRFYRNDPMLQGEFTVGMTPQSISMRNSAGATGQWNWNLYRNWRENKDIIVLAQRSGGFLPVNLAGLSGSQRNEVLAILGQALPKK
jgi:hypothetical protein